MTPLPAVAAGLVAAYLLGRLRPGERLFEWATGQVAQEDPQPSRYWLALSILVVSVVALWAVHPLGARFGRRFRRAARFNRPALAGNETALETS